MLEERRLAVLRAIVEDYVSTHEPVGSKALVERHNLGVSPATIRNDMAALEEEGFIAQPHTSAGRVPTDLGYRLFVDRLSTVKPLSPPERRAIHRFLDEAVDLDDVMSRTVRLLAQITRQVALVQYPSLTRSSIRHIDLVALTPSRLILIIIVDTGRVEQRVIEFTEPVNEQLLADVRARLVASLSGQPFASVPDAVEEFDTAFEPVDRPTVSAIVTAVLECARERTDERVVLGGTAHLARYGEAFPIAIQPVLEALEEQVVLLRLLGESTNPAAVTVRIGHENPFEGLAATSVVTATYGRGDQPVASLGVVGPTHMDYPGNIAAVQAVARYVSRILDEQ
ncbi:MAG: heat-inducible transcriptional repressor HrcA [Actinomycetales bacterium]|nr:heat-inducible transcriptional repressor HrcA [Actinomycetales bacterium]